MKGCKKVKD